MAEKKNNYFGTDGIRGTVGQEPITPDFVLRLANAVGQVLKKRFQNPVALIGKDTRISGYMLESALESGFNSAGVDVVLLGPVPTPAVAYLTRAQRANLGVVISASHNPFEDNGIKFFDASGAKLPDEWQEEVEEMLQNPPQWVSAANLGKARRLDDAAGRYIEFCKSTFSSHLSLRGIKIVVDAANGAAYHIAPKVFHELGAEVISIGVSPDGLNINKDCGATSPAALQKAVIENQAHCGIALDGDADRVQWVDSSGKLLNGDELIYLLAADRLNHLKLKNAPRPSQLGGVVGTLMTNMAVENAIRELGYKFIRAKVGDKYVLEELQKNNWILGGESSGHILVLDRHSTGDGLISALQILRACTASGKSATEQLAGLTLMPQILLNVELEKGKARKYETSHKYQEELKKSQSELQNKGRVLIRPSGTEPVVRVMVECHDEEKAREIAQKLAQTIKETNQ